MARLPKSPNPPVPAPKGYLSPIAETRLRDEFARTAMHGLVSGNWAVNEPAMYATSAYHIADAMMAQRRRGAA